jgi:hypothetical protein
MAYTIKLEGRGGMLDCRVVETKAEITSAVRDTVLNCEFAPGDVIIRIEDNEETDT